MRIQILKAGCVLAVLMYPGTAAAQVTTAPSAGTLASCPDRVAVTHFGMTKVAALVSKLTLTIKNNCPYTLNVPYRITVGTTVLASNWVQVRAGAQTSGHVSWNHSAGTFHFDAEADPANTMNESAASRANNLPVGFSYTLTQAQIDSAAAVTGWNMATANGAGSNQTPCTSDDKVRLTSFTVSPASAAPNQDVTITARISNLCSYKRSIAWSIIRGGVTAFSGTAFDVDGGGYATITRTWKASAGSHSINMLVDPANVIPETPVARTNNTRATPITMMVSP